MYESRDVAIAVSQISYGCYTNVNWAGAGKCSVVYLWLCWGWWVVVFIIVVLIQRNRSAGCQWKRRLDSKSQQEYLEHQEVFGLILCLTQVSPLLGTSWKWLSMSTSLWDIWSTWTFSDSSVLAFPKKKERYVNQWKWRAYHFYYNAHNNLGHSHWI